MAGKTLILKSGDAVMGAYVVAPLAGMTVLWTCITTFDLWASGSSAIIRDLLLLIWIFPLGTILCGVAELLLVTPLLFGFRRYRWKWLNGWTAGLIGFSAGSIPVFILERAHNFGGVIGVGDAVLSALLSGVVGLTVAMVFRLMAITTQVEPS